MKRDLYDLSFICNRYWNVLSEISIAVVRNAVGHKGIEQFDYVIKYQNDDVIDKDKLESDFLELYDRLGLLADQEIRQSRDRRDER